MRKPKIFLAILITVVFTIVPLASALELDFNVVGEDNMESLRRMQDSLRFNISIVGFEGQKIPSQTIFLNGYAIEPECKLISENNFLCNLSTQKNMVSTPLATYKIDIKVAGNVLATKSKEMVVDGLGPKVLSVSGLPEVVRNGQEIEVDVSVLDLGVEGGTYCSGISEVIVYQQNPNAPLKKVVVNSKECSFLAELNFSSNQISTGQICAVAKDGLGMASGEPYCKDITVDSLAPIVNEIELFRKGGSTELLPFNFAKANTNYQLAIVANITDDHILNQNDILGFFPEISLGSDGVKPSSCEEIANGLKCTWDNLNFFATADKTFNLKVSAQDSAGNLGEKIDSKQLQIDNLGPSVSGIISTYGEYFGVPFLGKTNTIVLKITDDKSGLLPENVFLNLEELGGPSKLKASYCNQSECYFENVKVVLETGTSVQIGINLDTADAVGNKVDFAYADGFVVDTSPPVIEEQSVVVMSDKGLIDLNGGDTAIITFRARDDTSVFVSGDFSEISKSGASKMACQEGSGFWDCIVEIPNLIAGAKGLAKITVTDLTNNSLTFEEEILVNVPHMGPKPDYWEVASIDVMEPGLDSSLGDVLSQQFFVTINLESKSVANEYSLSRFNILKCTQTGYKEKSIDVFLPATVGNSISIPAVFYLDKGQVSPSDIEVSCDVEIYTKIHSKTGVMLAKFPEIEQLNFTVPVFEGFSGLTTTEATEKFRVKMQEIKFGVGVMDTVDVLVNLAQTLCKVYQNTISLASLITTAVEMVGRPALNTLNLETALTALPLTTPIDNLFTGISKGLQNLATQFRFNLDPFCNAMACKLKVTSKVDVEGKTFSITTESMDKPLSLGDILGEDSGLKESFENVPVSSEDSIISGILTLCPTKVVNAFNNYLTSQCMVVECYGESLEQGFPMYQCDILQGYSTCKIVGGEIFGAIPFISYLNEEVLPGMATVLNDPTSMVFGLVGGLVCEAFSEVPFVPNLCAVTSLVNEAQAIYNDFIAIDKNKFELESILGIRTSNCKRVIDKYSKYLEE